MSELAEEIPASLAQFVEKPVEASKPIEAPPEPIEQVAVDPVTEKAQKSGWTDKDTWEAAGKDPDEWIDAKEFVSRKPLYDKLHAQSKALKEKDDKLEAVSKYAAKAFESGRQKALEELQAQKREAIQTGDVDAVEAVEKRIEEVRQELAPEAKPVDAAPEIPPAVKEFADRNEKWFEKDEPMTVFMVASTQKYTGAGKPLDEALKLAEADVKREFAHKFINPNKDKAAAVASNNVEARGKTYGYSDLNAGQRAVYSALKGKMTLDEFITGLKEQGELK